MTILSLFSKPNTQHPSSSFPATPFVLAKADNIRLATFIRKNEQPIIEHWEIFARTLVPDSDDKSPHALRDHIKEILAFIADDIESSQTDSEQEKKSEGKKPKNTEHSAAEIHASLRQVGGFSMDQMVSEFRRFAPA